MRFAYEKPCRIAAFSLDFRRLFRKQSETLADIHALRAEARRLAETDGPLPRPPGYCLFELCLESVEFWGNGTERLHERLRYDRDEGGWKHRYLQP
ncbi:putative pyridoxamine 5'-phosphate oxidase [Pseudomonas aeruginosa]|nr:putative pyridoxamine 5'-phosphate oxidase [Pseudomonas aeruginosa]